MFVWSPSFLAAGRCHCLLVTVLRWSLLFVVVVVVVAVVVVVVVVVVHSCFLVTVVCWSLFVARCCC